ncbi:MAG TPA: HEAT repeat domain-containing protein [Planctomycetota bacterium]|nr:HEAT repeat domain-containing protein [Planctomycetota bacterium]
MRRALVIVFIIAALARAEDPPETWADPTLEDALFAARVVARGHVQAPLKGETDPRLAIEKIVAGEGSPGMSVPLLGSKGPEALDKFVPPLAVGDEGIFILHLVGPVEKPSLELPTPSFGRFVIVDGQVGACVRDAFHPILMKAADYETFLKNAWSKAKGNKPDAAFVDSCRTTLAALDPSDKAHDKDAYIALEGLALAAEPRDAKLVARSFASQHFEVRVSAARALARAGGAEATDALLRLALNDKDPAVQTTALQGLATAKPTPADAKKDLLAHLKDFDPKSTPKHVNVFDPRTNAWDAPLATAFRTLRDLGWGENAIPAAIDLLGKDDGDTVAAACLHLAQTKARARAAEIAEKMRGPDNPYTKINDLLGDLLEELTGEDLGANHSDREAWRAFLKSGK